MASSYRHFYTGRESGHGLVSNPRRLTNNPAQHTRCERIRCPGRLRADASEPEADPALTGVHGLLRGELAVVGEVRVHVVLEPDGNRGPGHAEVAGRTHTGNR